MSRYIDADALEYDTEWSEYHDGFTAYSQLAIDTAPSIDIVFCKECKWGEVVRNHSIGFCENQCGVRSAITESSYCSYGEVRDE